MIYKELQEYIESALRSFDSISEERKRTLEKISSFVQKKQEEGKTSELIYVCTHNSRRSHLGQIWGKTAAAWYGLSNINTYSAGTETTAFNPNAINAVQKAGFRITKNDEGKNPVWSVHYNDAEQPITCFSKTYEDNSIPRKELCAIMTCTDADGNCPFIPGTESRISCPYHDPKAFDGTPQQDEKYNERCRQIAIENLYIFSLIKNSR
jgi:arsenate reductase (thioredoxin)